jgi:protein involved in polysaccharide export with SLBB domain
MRTALVAALLVVGCGTAPYPTAAPAPRESSTYTVRPGDLIRIDVWGQEEYSGQFQVDEAGLIHYPVIGTIDASAMTLDALRDTLRAGLEQIFTNPFITITPLFRIAVLGQVRTPGLYTVDPTLSVLDVVALAGGAAPAGDLGRIRVLRVGEETQLSFEQESLRGRSLQQIGIRSGDQVLVPRRFFTREDLYVVLQLAQIGLSIAIFVNTINP